MVTSTEQQVRDDHNNWLHAAGVEPRCAACRDDAQREAEARAQWRGMVERRLLDGHGRGQHAGRSEPGCPICEKYDREAAARRRRDDDRLTRIVVE